MSGGETRLDQGKGDGRVGGVFDQRGLFVMKKMKNCWR